MRLNDALNLVLSVRTDGNGNPILFAHSTPISREVFEANFRVISATYAEIFEHGIKYAVMAGPRIAALALVDHGKKEQAANVLDEGQGDNPAESLIAEIKRLTSIICPGENGWETLPVDVAIQRKRIAPDDWTDLLGNLVFFTCASAMAKRDAKRAIMEVIASSMRASIVSLNCTEYAASLPKSTETEGSTAAA